MVVVKTDAGEYTIKAGDLVTFPKGLKCTWGIKVKIVKVYILNNDLNKINNCKQPLFYSGCFLLSDLRTGFRCQITGCLG